ncbi:hypothetical protein D3C73_589000 [compost metagenome]
MSEQPVCLYCQQANAPDEVECGHCGMPLPAHAAGAGERRQRRFMWFCVGLTVFCFVMFFWLPRSIV